MVRSGTAWTESPYGASVTLRFAILLCAYLAAKCRQSNHPPALFNRLVVVPVLARLLGSTRILDDGWHGPTIGSGCWRPPQEHGREEHGRGRIVETCFLVSMCSNAPVTSGLTRIPRALLYTDYSMSAAYGRPCGLQEEEYVPSFTFSLPLVSLTSSNPKLRSRFPHRVRRRVLGTS